MQLDKFLCKFFLFLEEVTIYCFDFQQLHVSQFLGVVLLQFPDAVYQEQVVVLVCARLYINVSLTSSYNDYKKDTNSHIYYTLIVPIQSTLLVDDIFQHLKTRNNNKRSINTSGQRIRFLIQQESSKNSHKNARRQNIQQLLENNKKGNEQAKNTIRIVIYGDNEPQKCSKCQQKDNIQALMTGQDIRQGHEAIYQVRGQEVVDDLYNNQNQQWQIQDETDKLVIFLSIGQINLQTPEQKKCHQQHEKHNTDCIANLFNIIALLDISIKFLSGTIITFHNIIHLPDITISWCPCNVSLDLIFQQFEHDKYCIHYLNHFPQDVQVFSSDVEEYKVRQCMCIDFMQHFDRVRDIEIFYIIMEIVRILSNIKYHKGQYLNTPNQTYKIIIIKYIRQTTLMRQNNNFRYESSESDSSSDNYHEDSEHAEINVQYRVNSYRQQPEHNEDSYQRYEEEDEPHSHITYQHSSDIQGQNYMDEDQEDQGNSNFSWNSNSGFRGQIFQEQRRGMSEAQLNKIPMLKWTQQYEKINKEEKCPICLNSYEIGQQLRLIFCMHRFHQKCIDRWLQSNRSCPTCRNAIQQISQK